MSITVMERNILSECYIDLMLLQKLGFDPSEAHDSINNVFNRLDKYFVKKIGVGVIDDDKYIRHPYYKEFITVVPEKYGITLDKHKTRMQALIKIKPAAESLIQSAGNSKEISRDKYFPNCTDSQFRNITKKQTVSKNTQFQSYLNTIIQKNPPSFQYLKELLERTQQPSFYR